MNAYRCKQPRLEGRVSPGQAGEGAWQGRGMTFMFYHTHYVLFEPSMM